MENYFRSPDSNKSSIFVKLFMLHLSFRNAQKFWSKENHEEFKLTLTWTIRGHAGTKFSHMKSSTHPKFLGRSSTINSWTLSILRCVCLLNSVNTYEQKQEKGSQLKRASKSWKSRKNPQGSLDISEGQQHGFPGEMSDTDDDVGRGITVF